MITLIKQGPSNNGLEAKRTEISKEFEGNKRRRGDLNPLPVEISSSPKSKISIVKQLKKRSVFKIGELSASEDESLNLPKIDEPNED